MKSPDQAMFKTLLIVSVLIAVVMIPFAARAESTRQGPPVFEDFDTDGDGFVSEEEFLTLRSERMAARAAEGGKMKGAATAPPFSAVDTDGDGKLNQAEFTAGRDAQMKAMKEQHAGKGQGHGGKHGKGGMHGKGGKMPTFSDLDLNGDGCIDTGEFAAHQAERHGQKQKAPQAEP